MGYYTDYTIRVVEGEADLDLLAEHLENETRYSASVYSGAIHINDAKWYDHETEMQAISAAFPDHVFEVEGVGEEYPDIWVQRFHAGKSTPKVKASISFPGIGTP